MAETRGAIEIDHGSYTLCGNEICQETTIAATDMESAQTKIAEMRRRGIEFHVDQVVNVPTVSNHAVSDWSKCRWEPAGSAWKRTRKPEND